MENGRGEYLGQIEPKHGQRLIRLMEGGNKYTAAIVSSTEDTVFVIIREVYQDPSQAGRLSFPSRRLEGVQPYVSDRIFRPGLEYEEALPGEPGYTIIGGGEGELLPEELPEIVNEADNDEADNNEE